MTDVQIDGLRIAAPCPASWQGMAGDDRVRHCTLCRLNVYNFAEMTREEVHELLVQTEGRFCARLYRRADGTVLTRDCPTGLRALRRRASRVVAALITALLSLPAVGLGSSTWKKPRLQTHGAKIKLTVEQIATPQPAVLAGVVLLDDSPLPGATITVQDESTQQRMTLITDGTGAFKTASLDDGMYRVDVALEGLRPARIDHLLLKAGEVTHASFAVQVDTINEIVVGAIALPLSTDNGLSTNFTQDFINKLPL
jgi:hypothetical protein